MVDGLPDDLADALGLVIAEQQERWEREHAAFMAELRAEAAEHRALVVEQKAVITELQGQLKSAMDDQHARIAAVLAGVKNGDRGPQGEPGARGQDAPPPTIEQISDAIAGMDGLKEAVQDAVRIEYAANPPPSGKDGAPGERGPDGPAGPQGAPGDPGEPGLPGESGKDGAPGEPGLSGKDAEPITRDQIVEAALACGDAINDAAARYLRANPPLNGKDGVPGPSGPPGDPGRDGRDGLPGVPGTSGRDGVNGKDGADGLGFDDYTEELSEDGRTRIRRWMLGERVKEFREPVYGLRYCGVWKDGSYHQGDAVTWDGSVWIAAQDTVDKPEKSDAWKLAVRKGRDGKDGIMKVEEPHKPVTLR